MDSILFHGSSQVVDAPAKEKGKLHNDYGQGFYCTPDIELAREWACSEKPQAFVGHYSFEPSFKLKVCNLSGKDYHVLNWLAVLVRNRCFETKHPVASSVKEYLLEVFLPDLSAFDVIRGYRADDAYFDIASSFIDNSISLRQLSRALHLGNLGEQYFIQSEKAFEALTFTSAEIVDHDIYYRKRLLRDQQAREAFKTLKKEAFRPDDIFAIDILRGKWKNDDERIR